MNIFYFTMFRFLWVAVGADLTPCTTPNGETASCVPVIRCPVLLQAGGSNETIALKFFNESVCDENTSTVCCGAFGNFTKTLTTPKPLSKQEIFDGLSKEKKKDYVLKHLLPNKTYCGMQHTDDYFYDGAETSVDEFPWLVYIIESNDWRPTSHGQLRFEINCVGALITRRHVLTTYNCMQYASNQFTSNRVNNGQDFLSEEFRRLYFSQRVYTMIFGVHHLHKNISCIDWRVGVEDCTKPALRVYASQAKINEEVILFRLNNPIIEYTDFTRPICLPLQTDEIPTTGSVVMASGWSEKELVTGKRLKLKKRMKYTVMSKKDCETNNPLRNVICGISLKKNTHYICNGDIGGPLMYRHMNRNWIAVGLIYQTVTGLCDEAQPATAVVLTPEMVNWIIENIEP